MATIAIRVAVRRSSHRLCAAAGIGMTQSVGISSAGGVSRQKEYKPFDYRRKLFTVLHQPFDRSHKRFDENSKVIVIDGPMASGKHEFGRRLAKELDFKFVPQARVQDLYQVGDTGLAYTDLDELLPDSCRVYTQSKFYNDAKAKLADGGGRAGALQLDWFTARLFTYNDALLHLFSTGQGVVCIRSPWSDGVFAKALFDNGYMSKAGYNYYRNEIARNHLCDYPRPHLTIYLDADVEATKDNIKRRAQVDEVKTDVLSNNYLRSMEIEYKDKVLPGLEGHGELLVYPSIPDITDHEVQLMVDDIEALGPMAHTGIADDHHLEDWSMMKDEELAYKRRDYQNLRCAKKIYSHDRPFVAPEMNRDEYFNLTRGTLYNYTPGYKYEKGSDPDIDSFASILMGFGSEKLKNSDRRHFWIPE